MMRPGISGICLPVVVAAQLGSAAPAVASPHTFIVGLSEDCVPTTEALSQQLMQLFVKRLHPGDGLVVYDAPHRSVIASAVLPDRDVFERVPVRIREFGGELAKIKHFLDTRCAATAAVAQPAGNLYLPQFLDEIARVRIPALPRESVSVLIVGSALYNDARDPGLSMLEGHYPSDSHLNAKPAASIFSTAEKHEALTGVDVHYCFTDAEWWSEAHKEAVRRWWSLFVNTQQGALATFSGDLPSCFERFEGSVTAGAAPSFRPEPGSGGLQMLLAKRAPVEREVVAAVPTPMTPAAAARDEVAASPVAPGGFLDIHAPISHDRPHSTRGLVKIGIRWACPVDLDLYARSSASSDFLYFGHRDTPEGHFPHDYTNAPDGSAFEYVEFTREIDLSTLEAFVNFYGGTCQTGPSGIVRLWFENRVYEGHFALSAKQGNQGDGRDSHMTGSYWTQINVKKLLHVE
jgi:hypothetical protein